MAGPLVVLGDALLDADLTGRAARLAPDAPAPVLDQLEEALRPGGAALAAVLAAQEADGVVLVTALADDEEAATLADLVTDAGVRLVAVPLGGRTPVKRRVRAGGQTLLRLDVDDRIPPGHPTDEALEAIAGAGALLVSDYGRGLTSLELVRREVAAVAVRTPVVWDPHPRGATPVPGARLVTPNAAEAAVLSAGLGVDGSGKTGLAAVSTQAAGLAAAWAAHAVAVTLGDRGALLSHGESSPSVIPAPSVRAMDTCGAGDRFAAGAAVALAGGAVTLEAAQVAVQAATDFVAAGGAAALARRTPPPDQTKPDPTRPEGRPETVVATGGCFDLLHAGHVATLEAARALGDRLVVCLNSDSSVRRLKGPGRPLVPQADRARVLAALEPVDDVVVFDADTPAEVLRRIRPDIWAKGGDYAGAELPEAAILREWGGQSVVLPYLDGRSTTRLVSTAAARTEPTRQ